MVIINAAAVDAAGQTLEQYLAESNYTSGRIAVERNGEIVPRAQYGSTILADGDRLEIVRFVGGG